MQDFGNNSDEANEEQSEFLRSCFIFKETPHGPSLLPVSLQELQRLILARQEGPPTLVTTDEPAQRDDCVPLKHRPDLVPFGPIELQAEHEYRSGNHQACLATVRFYAEFDSARIQSGYALLRLFEALILEQNRPREAEEIYLELIEIDGHRLKAVCHNNLAVLRIKLNRLPEALPHLRDSTIKAVRPSLTALLNLKSLIEQFKDSGEVDDQTDPSFGNVRIFGKHEGKDHTWDTVAKEVGKKLAELSESADDEGDPFKWDRLTGESLARFIDEGQLGTRLAQLNLAAGKKLVALGSLERARRAECAEMWQEVRLWAEFAFRVDPDSAVRLEYKRLVKNANLAEKNQNQANLAADFDRDLAEISRLESLGSFQEAKALAGKFSSKLLGHEFKGSVVDAAKRVLAGVKQRQSDRRREQGDAVFEEAAALFADNPDQARGLFKVAARLNPELRERVNVIMSLPALDRLVEEFSDKLKPSKLGEEAYAAAYKKIRQIEDLPAAVHWSELTEDMRDELKTIQAEDELVKAEAANARGVEHASRARDHALRAKQLQPKCTDRVSRFLSEQAVAAIERKYSEFTTKLHGEDWENEYTQLKQLVIEVHSLGHSPNMKPEHQQMATLMLDQLERRKGEKELEGATLEAETESERDEILKKIRHAGRRHEDLRDTADNWAESIREQAFLKSKEAILSEIWALESNDVRATYQDGEGEASNKFFGLDQFYKLDEEDLSTVEGLNLTDEILTTLAEKRDKRVSGLLMKALVAETGALFKNPEGMSLFLAEAKKLNPIGRGVMECEWIFELEGRLLDVRKSVEEGQLDQALVALWTPLFCGTTLKDKSQYPDQLSWLLDRKLNTIHSQAIHLWYEIASWDLRKNVDVGADTGEAQALLVQARGALERSDLIEFADWLVQILSHLENCKPVKTVCEKLFNSGERFFRPLLRPDSPVSLSVVARLLEWGLTNSENRLHQHVIELIEKVAAVHDIEIVREDEPAVASDQEGSTG